MHEPSTAPKPSTFTTKIRNAKHTWARLNRSQKTSLSGLLGIAFLTLSLPVAMGAAQLAQVLNFGRAASPVTPPSTPVPTTAFAQSVVIQNTNETSIPVNYLKNSAFSKPGVFKPYTIDMWIKFYPYDSTTSTLTRMPILTRVSQATGKVIDTLYLDESYDNTTYRLSYDPRSPYPYSPINSSTVLNPNTWYHIALVFAAQNSGCAALYVNGTQEAYSCNTATADSTEPLDMYVGLMPGKTTGFNGEIDEMRISNSKRYASNFTPLTKPYTADSYTVSLYHFDYGTYDNSGKGNDWQVNGEVFYNTSTVPVPEPTPTPTPTISPTPTSSPAPSPSPIATCTDTDNGRDYYTAGELRYTNNPYGILTQNDNCDGTAVIEGVCNSQTEYTQNTERYTCPFGCNAGKCLSSAPTPTPICKIGINSFGVNTPCGSNFRYATVECYDGYQQTLGSSSSCKSSVEWSYEAKLICANRSSCPKPTPTPTSSPKPTPTPTPNPTPTPKPNHVPTITTQRLNNGRVGSYYNSAILGFDQDKTDTLSFIAANLPQGLSVTNCSSPSYFSIRFITCRITGKPSVAGLYTPTLTLQDSSGGMDQRQFQITIQPISVKNSRFPIPIPFLR